MIAWLITGTRNLDDAGRRIVERTMRKQAQAHGYPDIVIHGAEPKGVDAFADGLCKRRGIKTLPMPADWEGWRAKGDVNRAGPERNKAMVKAALGLEEEGWTVRYLAFPRGKSTGTRGCLRLCQAAGLDGVVVELEVENV